jgi:small subunit ribosomal protein S5
MNERSTEKSQQQDSDHIEKLVLINRVAKVIKGGRRLSFASLVVVGDGKGRIGFGTGKAREVPDAIRKASESARKNMIRIPLREGRTLHHDITSKYGAGYVHMRSAPPGTGIIAGGAMRAIFEALGIQDVVAKSIGSANRYNMVRATFKGLSEMQSPRDVAARRGKKVSELIARRRQTGSDDSDATEATAAPKKASGKESAPAKKHVEKKTSEKNSKTSDAVKADADSQNNGGKDD